MSDAGISERAVLYDDRCIKTGYQAPEYITEMLAQVFPTVVLEWHPKLRRWTLWEKHGRGLSLIAALAGPNGEYVKPNRHNTIGLLARSRTVDLRRSQHDFNQWLDDLDREPDHILSQRAQAEARIHEGSKAYWDLLHGKTQIQVDKR